MSNSQIGPRPALKKKKEFMLGIINLPVNLWQRRSQTLKRRTYYCHVPQPM